jgi:hypothetical protein
MVTDGKRVLYLYCTGAVLILYWAGCFLIRVM